MIFIVLSSLKTVHDIVQYSYRIFFIALRFLMIRLKRQNRLLPYARENEKELCKCTI
jgi:hypothetical protein